MPWSPCCAAGTTVTLVTVFTSPSARVVLKTTDCVIELWLSSVVDDLDSSVVLLGGDVDVDVDAARVLDEGAWEVRDGDGPEVLEVPEVQLSFELGT